MTGDHAHPHFPVFLDLTGRLVTVIGGGTVAESRIRAVLDQGADVQVIAPLVTPGIDGLVAEGRIAHEERGYVRGDLAGAFVVICATDSIEVDRAVYQEAEGQGCLVHVVGVPELSNFIVPEVVTRGPLQVAVSTAGVAPIVVSGIIGQFEHEYGEEWERYMVLLGQIRSLLAERLPGREDLHRVALDAIDSSSLFEQVSQGEDLDAETVLEDVMRAEGLAS